MSKGNQWKCKNCDGQFSYDKIVKRRDAHIYGCPNCYEENCLMAIGTNRKITEYQQAHIDKIIQQSDRVKTGIITLDKYLEGGLEPNELTTIVASPKGNHPEIDK